MPPVLILIAGAIGAFVAARWFAREAKRVNAELHRARQSPGGDPVPLRRRHDGTFGPE